ncbi:MAG: alanine--glyoxylate aminotransferase family protein [Anaerolineaceae bacterium]|nr:alanine--glyoxylate aminotransferase family protein [Anaerolineaceae bacterium]
MPESVHQRLVLPGPVEVRPEVLQAQTAWMIGHRTAAFEELFARLQRKLRQVFLTDYRVYVSGSSGSGLWEGALRNSVRPDRKVLHLTAGAFSERWAQVSRANGLHADVIAVDWGQAHDPQMVRDALQRERYDALCVVHNETSTGVTNPLHDIAGVLRDHEETLLLVDTVSGLAGAELRVDDWGIDVALTSSQKALALPPGIAFGSVSDRVLERAATIEHRGYYFDFLELEKSLLKNNTPTTPPVALMFAADLQLDDILAEGLAARWARHLHMRDRMHTWMRARDFGFYAQAGRRSPTVTAVENTRGIDVGAMAEFMAGRGFAMDTGYGKIRGLTFRVAHMGDMQAEELDEILAGLEAFLERRHDLAHSGPR